MSAVGSPVDQGRMCLLGGETRRRGFLGRTGVKGMLIGAAFGALALVVIVAARSLVVLVAVAVLAAIVWVARQRVTVEGDSWLGQRKDRLIAFVGQRSGASRYTPEVADDGRMVVPREVGRIEFMGVAPSEGRAELAIARHGTSYFSTTLEVVGGGDGLREQAEVDRFGLKFGRLLYAVSRPEIPVDQIDLATRVLPVEPEEYEQYVESRLDPRMSTLLADNLRELARGVRATGESYRTFMTLSMPADALARRAALRGPVNADTLAEAAYEATGQVAQEAGRQGLQVRQALTPRRLAALIRHQYAPSMGIDDTTDVTSPRASWPAYRAHREGVEVLGPDGQRWWHATAVVPRDGWPLREVGVRWLESLVSEISPSMIRTIHAQHHLQAKAKTRAAASMANTLDQAEILAQSKRGQTSTGEREAQAEGSALVLHDLLYESAAGDMPQLRVTISARSREELLSARQRMEGAMQDCDINRIRWYDHRHHHAHLLTVPLGRGTKR